MRGLVHSTLLNRVSKRILDEEDVVLILSFCRQSIVFQQYSDTIESVEDNLMTIDVGHDDDIDTEEMYLYRSLGDLIYI